MICRGEFPWPVYDFHHLKPAEKKVQMSDAIRARWEVMEKEMYKCILVCVNCHRMIHRCPKELWVNKSTKKE
jgi:predicted HNH restriction endonuclease